MVDYNVFLVIACLFLTFSTGLSMKCFTCFFTIAKCTDLNCYNSPDTCSPRFFTSAVVPYQECPAGCEMASISDANGIVLEWRRGCDLSGTTLGQPLDFTSNCKTEYVFGTRFDKCSCNQDFCNSQSSLRPSFFAVTSLFITFLLKYLF